MTEETLRRDPAVGDNDDVQEDDANEIRSPAHNTTSSRQDDDEPEDASSESSPSSDDDDDDLILEGVLIRNPEVASSSDDSESEESSEDESRSLVDKKRKVDTPPTHKKKKKTCQVIDNVTHVDFTFCDMHIDFFHGLKTLLHSSSSSIYAPHSSALADLVISNVAVGTLISTDGDTEHNVYGFASILNVMTYQKAPCIQAWKKLSLEHCPPHHRVELQTVLSGKTARPAGFLLHSRMANLPLELVEVLHQQLLLDIDWAVEHAPTDERKSHDFGALVRLAPAYDNGSSGGAGITYKYFDDEILASHAEFTYELPTSTSKALTTEQKQKCQLIVMTKTGHRAALKDLTKLVKGS